jgi:hypothetical protein
MVPSSGHVNAQNSGAVLIRNKILKYHFICAITVTQLAGPIFLTAY